MPKYATNDDYLAAVTNPAHREALLQLREWIREAAPDAVEAPVYGVAGFKWRGRALVAFAAFQHHCGFYPLSPAVIAGHAEALAPYRVAEGTVRFQPERPLGPGLVRDLVATRLRELSAGGAAPPDGRDGGRHAR